MKYEKMRKQSQQKKQIFTFFTENCEITVFYCLFYQKVSVEKCKISAKAFVFLSFIN